MYEQNTFKDKKVTHYEGLEGVRSVNINSLKAKDKLCIFETSYASLNKFFTEDEAEDVRQRFLEQKTKIYQLTNQPFHSTYTNLARFHEEVMSIRYVNPDKLKIATEMLVYDDIVAIYSVVDPIYAVEIQDPAFANMQQQMLWYV